MPTIEELEHRISRLEVLFEELIKDRLTYISQRLDQLYEKTERDKRELIYWMVGLILGFSTLTITAIWAILSFALK
jgi:uncharacterized Rmd1/YagE family protein